MSGCYRWPMSEGSEPSVLHPSTRSCRRPGEEPLQSSRPVGLLRYPARDFKRRPRHSDSSSRRFQLKTGEMSAAARAAPIKAEAHDAWFGECGAQTAVGAVPASFLRGQRGRRRPTRRYRRRVPLSSSTTSGGFVSKGWKTGCLKRATGRCVDCFEIPFHLLSQKWWFVSALKRT